MEELAPAKINLALHVRGRQPNGYHDIETVFAFAQDGDRLRVAAADELTLNVQGPFAAGLSEGDDNLVLKAAHALQARFGVTTGAALTLEKNLPVASGIGGGSADAGAALRLLSRWWNLTGTDEALVEIAEGLGADVPACLWSQTARGVGRGDTLSSQDGAGLAGTPLLLVNPGVPLSTAQVFGAWDGVDRGALPMASALATAIEGRNDLEPPACGLVPEIGRLIEMLRESDGVIVARMSGSGATCFALYESEEARDAAGAAIAAEQPGWWQMRTRIR